MIGHSIRFKRTAALFFDFTAAFPSLAHTFLWEGLEAAGIPTFIIDAIKQLYSNNAHWLKLKGGAFPSIIWAETRMPLEPKTLHHSWRSHFMLYQKALECQRPHQRLRRRHRCGPQRYLEIYSCTRLGLPHCCSCLRVRTQSSQVCTCSSVGPIGGAITPPPRSCTILDGI